MQGIVRLRFTTRNQRGETMKSDGVVIALPAPYTHALLKPHGEKNKAVRKVLELLDGVNYEPMIGAIFGTTKIDFKNAFSALFTDDVTAPVFWLSQENARRNLGIRPDEMAFALQLGAGERRAARVRRPMGEGPAQLARDGGEVGVDVTLEHPGRFPRDPGPSTTAAGTRSGAGARMAA